MCDRMGIDVWEVIDAAATKPSASCPSTPVRVWAGIAFHRSLLSFVEDRQAGIEARTSSNWRGYINGRCPTLWPTRCKSALNDAGKPVKRIAHPRHGVA